MNSLTKAYRLIWDENKIIVGDPFVEQLNSTTLINTTNYFETDNFSEVQPKIDELGLVFPPDEIIEEEYIEVNPTDPE